jgi:hypothetical protein
LNPQPLIPNIWMGWPMFPHFCSFTYALSKMLGRQFSLPPEIALRPVDALSGYQLAWLYYGLTGGGLLSHGTAELRKDMSSFAIDSGEENSYSRTAPEGVKGTDH